MVFLLGTTGGHLNGLGFQPGVVPLFGVSAIMARRKVRLVEMGREAAVRAELLDHDQLPAIDGDA